MISIIKRINVYDIFNNTLNILKTLQFDENAGQNDTSRTRALYFLVEIFPFPFNLLHFIVLKMENKFG